MFERSKISAAREATESKLSSVVRKLPSPSWCCSIRSAISACRSFSSRAYLSYSSCVILQQGAYGRAADGTDDRLLKGLGAVVVIVAGQERPIAHGVAGMAEPEQDFVAGRIHFANADEAAFDAVNPMAFITLVKDHVAGKVLAADLTLIQERQFFVGQDTPFGAAPRRQVKQFPEVSVLSPSFMVGHFSADALWKTYRTRWAPTIIFWRSLWALAPCTAADAGVAAT